MIIANGTYRYPVRFVEHPKGQYTKFLVTSVNSREKNELHGGFYPVYVFTNEKLDILDGDFVVFDRINQLSFIMGHKKGHDGLYPYPTIQADFKVIKNPNSDLRKVTDTSIPSEDDLPF